MELAGKGMEGMKDKYWISDEGTRERQRKANIFASLS
jgi:hypothetical protein